MSEANISIRPTPRSITPIILRCIWVNSLCVVLFEVYSTVEDLLRRAATMTIIAYNIKTITTNIVDAVSIFKEFYMRLQSQAINAMAITPTTTTVPTICLSEAVIGSLGFLGRLCIASQTAPTIKKLNRLIDIFLTKITLNHESQK